MTDSDGDGDDFIAGGSSGEQGAGHDQSEQESRITPVRNAIETRRMKDDKKNKRNVKTVRDET